MRVTSRLMATAALGAALVLGACAPSGTNETPSAGGGDDGEPTPIDIGVIYSRTGPLAAYGENYMQGFEAGLAYATDGTNVAGGYEITLDVVDDGGDANKAVTAFKDMVGRGVPIIVGTVDSGIALQLAPLAEQDQTVYIVGPAAADAITGINGYTFRSGRQSYQDVATAGTFLDDVEGADVLVLGQDSAFGQGNVAAVEAVLGGAGASVDSLLVPGSATEFTPFAQQVLTADPDLLFVAWAGETTAAMWQAMEQQGVLEDITVATGLANEASFQAYGPGSGSINFLNHYFAGAAGNDVEAAMIEEITAAGGTPDLFSPDGFNAALMVVHALEEGAASPDDVVAALEGWSFEGPKGEMTIRQSDHALLQPMFQASLVDEGGQWSPELLGAVEPEQVAPPEAS